MLISTDAISLNASLAKYGGVQTPVFRPIAHLGPHAEDARTQIPLNAALPKSIH